MISSLNASVLSILLSNPFDVYKTRIQLLDSQSQARQKMKSTWTVSQFILLLFDLIFLTFKTIRFTDFFKGIEVRMMRKFFNSAIVWVLYEKFTE